MENINNFYFINLKRREDRKYHFVEQCIRENIPLEKICRVDAIDGLNYPFHIGELTMFSKADFLNNPENIIKKIIGNQLSHYYLMKEVIKQEKEFVVIFQDDAVLISNFMEHINTLMLHLPKDAELINIGLHKSADLAYSEPWDFATEGNDFDKIGSQKINEYVCKMKPEINPCSLAYIITLEGAKNMTKYFEENGFNATTDFNFNEYLIKKDIFYSSNTVLVTGNPTLGSDIFKLD
jgi:GR25 family glycosyltransferase involved in LPS biosynthesis